ncbi:MAG: flagellar basal body P-ring formation chaperone FlgA [Burkholderiaceae bacterium]
MNKPLSYALAAIALSLSAAPAPAQDADPGEAIVRRFVESQVGAGNRVEVVVGQLDPRWRLAPCERIEPFVPAGIRLWGRTSIGVRCVQGANWTISLPVTVKVFGNALVANQNLAYNAPAFAQQFRLEEVDLTREPAQLVTDSAQIDGKVMARPISAGQALRQDHLRVAQTISAGDPVKVRIVGEGFAVSADGVALSPGGDGQTLRVRLDNGKILAGTVKDRGVEIRL